MRLQRLVRRVAERRRRHRPVSLPDLLPEQRNYFDCAARWKALFTPRRCGKSYTLGSEFVIDAHRFPGRRQLYFGLNLAHAWGVIYTETLEPMLEQRGIRHGHNAATGLVTFPNGSSIQIAGLDASPRQLDNVLGGKPHRAVVDEMQSQTQDMRHFVRDKIWPALQDYARSGGGWLELAGTPGDYMGDHYWYAITRTEEDGSPSADRDPEWRVFSWPMTANPFMREQFEAEAERRRVAAAGRYDWARAPDWRRQWLGHWVHESSAKVYRCFGDKPIGVGGNLLDDAGIAASLLRPDPEWTFLVGADLGWKDATAIVLGAYRAADPRFYVVSSFARSGMTYSSLGRELEQLAKKYNPPRIVVDVSNGPARQLAESLRSDFGLPVVAAEKAEKASAIGRMNGDFAEGRIVCLPDNRELFKEWLELVLDPKAPAWAEHEKFANHLADAALYAWRDSLHRFQRPPEPKAAPTVQERVKAHRALERARQLPAADVGAWSTGDWG